MFRYTAAIGFRLSTLLKLVVEIQAKSNVIRTAPILWASPRGDTPRISAFLLIAAIMLVEAPVASAQNIILVIADDMGADATEAYGEATPVAPTPTINSLAASGILFRNAWATPVCSPFRASVITGRNPSDHGIGHGINPNDPDRTFTLTNQSNLARILSNANYRTAAVGKAHLGADPNDPIPIFDPSIDPQEIHMENLGFDHYDGFLFGGSDYYDWPHTISGITTHEYEYETTVNADAAITAIAGSEPFFLWLAFQAPHGIYNEPPNELLADPSIYNGFTTGDDKYMAMIEAMDTELGRVLAEVDFSDTTVIFVGDNGTPSGQINPTLLSNHAKATVYEGGLNVPLIVAGQAVSSGAYGTESGALVQATDLFPTILQIAGVAAPPRPDAVSLVRYLADSSIPSIRSTVFSELFTPNGGPIDASSHLRAARNARYKLIRNGSDPDEFYDLDVDPYEQSPLDLGALSLVEAASYAALDTVINAHIPAVAVPAFSNLSVTILITLVTITGSIAVLGGVRRSRSRRKFANPE